MNIIDNESGGGTNKDKYKEIPNDLMDLLTGFLEKLKLERKSILVANMTPTRMHMRWREPRKEIDGGLFTLRHLEFYKGEKVQDWDCGMKRDDPNLRQRIRAYVISTNATHEINELKLENINRAFEFDVGFNGWSYLRLTTVTK